MNAPRPPSDAIGVVVIGRNEGERLRRCLAALQPTGCAVVYVDSGSTDGSVAMARGQGVEVVELDMRVPFTAARARNAGFDRLMQVRPALEFVQFIDGDCELIDGWLAAALAFLHDQPAVACVCGTLRERHPEHSLFNQLCAMEWDRPAGETTACGGIAMMRAGAFRDAGGFRAEMTAGEEPELCLRLRSAGHRVWRIGHDMAWHDAAITHLSQWWRRAMRGGYATAEGVALHGDHPLAGYRRKRRQTMIWGLLLPLAAVALSPFSGWALLLFALYPLKWLRMALRADTRHAGRWLSSGFTLLAGFAEAAGIIKYGLQKRSHGNVRAIEYK